MSLQFSTSISILVPCKIYLILISMCNESNNLFDFTLKAKQFQFQFQFHHPYVLCVVHRYKRRSYYIFNPLCMSMSNDLLSSQLELLSDCNHQMIYFKSLTILIGQKLWRQSLQFAFSKLTIIIRRLLSLHDSNRELGKPIVRSSFW